MLRTPNVILLGGPDIPESDRIQYLENTSERFKLFRGNRYEHFDPTPRYSQHLGRQVKVFHWVRSTFVAE